MWEYSSSPCHYDDEMWNDEKKICVSLHLFPKKVEKKQEDVHKSRNIQTGNTKNTIQCVMEIEREKNTKGSLSPFYIIFFYNLCVCHIYSEWTYLVHKYRRFVVFVVTEIRLEPSQSLIVFFSFLVCVCMCVDIWVWAYMCLLPTTGYWLHKYCLPLLIFVLCIQTSFAVIYFPKTK